MLSRMSWKQFAEWQAYDEIEPFGDKRGDWQAASIASAIFNALMIFVRSRKRFRVMDFLLKFGKEREEKEGPKTERQTWQEQRMIAQMFAAAFNSDGKKKRRASRP